jgi:hypothetical protein
MSKEIIDVGKLEQIGEGGRALSTNVAKEGLLRFIWILMTRILSAM